MIIGTGQDLGHNSPSQLACALIRFQNHFYFRANFDVITIFSVHASIIPNILKEELLNLPRIAPIIPRLSKHPFDNPKCIYEPKFDGFRGILYIDNEESHFRSKHGNILNFYAGLAKKVRQELGVTAAILDGEIAVLDPKTGQADFNALHRHLALAVYMAFDLVWLGSQNLAHLKLTERKKLLRALIRQEGWIKFVDSVDGQGKLFMDQIVAAGVEGMVAKEKNGIYAKRTVWRKVLNPNLMEEKRRRARMFNKFRERLKA
jgi:ATP-dependent DNA ligase